MALVLFSPEVISTNGWKNYRLNLNFVQPWRRNGKYVSEFMK
jgi:hypothetical protein